MLNCFWVAWFHLGFPFFLFFASNSFQFFSFQPLNCLCYYDFLLVTCSSSSYPLTFVLLFLFASLSSSQLMTTNTQMVSLSLSLCRLSLVSLPCFATVTQPDTNCCSSHVRPSVLAVDTSAVGFSVVTRCFPDPCSCVQLSVTKHLSYTSCVLCLWQMLGLLLKAGHKCSCFHYVTVRDHCLKHYNFL